MVIEITVKEFSQKLDKEYKKSKRIPDFALLHPSALKELLKETKKLYPLGIAARSEGLATDAFFDGTHAIHLLPVMELETVIFLYDSEGKKK